MIETYIPHMLRKGDRYAVKILRRKGDSESVLDEKSECVISEIVTARSIEIVRSAVEHYKNDIKYIIEKL